MFQFLVGIMVQYSFFCLHFVSNQPLCFVVTWISSLGGNALGHERNVHRPGFESRRDNCNCGFSSTGLIPAITFPFEYHVKTQHY